MNFAAVRLPASIALGVPEASAQLDQARAKRLEQLAREGWQPSAGWLTDRAPIRPKRPVAIDWTESLPAILRRQAS